jgi:hypothetical protein
VGKEGVQSYRQHISVHFSMSILELLNQLIDFHENCLQYQVTDGQPAAVISVGWISETEPVNRPRSEERMPSHSAVLGPCNL